MSFVRPRVTWLALSILVISSLASAHEARPAYLELKETAPGQYSVLWRTPVLAGMRLPVALALPDDVKNLSAPNVQELADSVVERRSIDAGANGLAGKRIEFPGLQLTIADVLVRVEMLDGRKWTTIVHPSQPWVEIAASQSWAGVVGTYILQGIRHILFGADHMLFVLGLLLIVKDRWMLLKTVTAFTVAHSITLAIATLGYAEVPVVPLNAAIALSILFLGPKSCVPGKARPASPFAIRGSWHLLSDYCTASALPAHLQVQAYPSMSCHWPWSASTSASNWGSSVSSPWSWHWNAHSASLKSGGHGGLKLCPGIPSVVWEHSGRSNGSRFFSVVHDDGAKGHQRIVLARR